MIKNVLASLLLSTALASAAPPVLSNPPLSLDQAQSAVKAGIDCAKAANILENFAVVDADGRMVLVVHMDWAISGGTVGALLKAEGSAIFGQSSTALATGVGAGPWNQPPTTSLTTVAKPTLPAVGAGMFPEGLYPSYSQGAYPIVHDGHVVGAVGVGGGTPAQDDACALAASTAG